MRPPPTVPVPSLDRREDVVIDIAGATTPIVAQTRRYRLMTPLFGGGVDPAVADPVTIIRGSAIRGHLRFWWRATRGGRFNGDLQSMKEAEDQLWDAASTATQPRPSCVQVIVDRVERGREFPVTGNNGQPVSIGHFRSPYSYAAFPLQGKPEATVRQGVEFSLTIRFPEDKQEDVEAAVWAWEMFGGIGARTRRGFGALRCIEVDGKVASHPADVTSTITQLRRAYGRYVAPPSTTQGQRAVGVWPTYVPSLGRGMRLTVMPVQEPLTAWRHLLDSLKQFRQARHGPQGRSKWPEPDEIRHLTGQSLPGHHARLSMVAKFPRAAFGLPIIFQFKDSDKDYPANPNKDPRKTVLQRPGCDRLASPLILRPLPCANDRAVGLALVLSEPGLTQTLSSAILQEQGGPASWSAPTSLTPTEASTPDLIDVLDGQSDVLEAFLRYLEREKGGSRV